MRRVAVLSLALFLAVACSVAGSDAPKPPSRSCTVTVWYKATTDRAEVAVVGSWDAWARPGRLLGAGRADGWRVTALDLAPGAYSYAIIDDGVWIADPNVPTSAFHEGKEVAEVAVPNCDAPAIRVDGATGSADGAAKIEASFLAARSGDALDPASISVTPAGSVVASDAAKGTLTIAVSGLPPGKHALTLHAKDTRGRDAEPARATVWIEPRPFELRDSAIYQVMVDRYRGKDGAALAQPSLASGRAGGHVDGVRKAIESGELAAMGFNTVWLSPLYANPSGTFPGADGRPYSSYHGYWPIAPRALEPAVADEAAVDALIAAAHARGIRVLFDVVPNHVHEQHPYFTAHKKDAWFNNVDASCVCGAAQCDWATHILDCWFAPYLPDLDWTNSAVAVQASADVAWWLDRFDADGIRIDAVPMMPRAATRRIAAEIRARFDHPGHKSFLLGENFTGPGGYGLIRYELGPFGLDSEFHFPLLWALRGAIAEETATLADLDAAILTGQAAWEGSGAVMATMIGNHDVARFASVSAGDGGGDNWTAAPQSADAKIYAKQQMALGVIFTLPGAPVVYYGDEVALAGHADPDARRVLPGEADLTALQKATRDRVRVFGKARACSEALRRGTYRTLAVDPEHLVFARETASDRAVIVVQRDVASPYAAALPGILPGDYVDVVSGRTASLRPELTNLEPQPFSVQLYLPAESPCR